MKILKILGLTALVLALIILALPAVLSSSAHVERSMTIAAPAEKVFAAVTDMHQFKEWNEWARMDPTTQVTVTGTGIGSAYEWQAEQMGTGKMTLTAMDPTRRADFDMDFGEPMPGKAKVYFTIAPNSEQSSEVTWGYDQDLPYFSRYFGLIMDKMLGPSFEKGLQNLSEHLQKAR